MGCDGGTIPRRDELVKTKKKAEAKDKDSELAFQWLCCAISQQLLSAPVVMCGLGRLYNKLSVIEGLLNRSTLPETARHIKNLKDIRELKLAPNPEYKAQDEKKGDSTEERACPYICPIAGLEMSGKFKFIALWSCGCVISERAFKQIGDKVCVNCQTAFTDEDVVILNAKDDDLKLMTERMEIRRARSKSGKEKKQKVKKEVETGESSTSCNSKEKSGSSELVKTGLKRPCAIVPNTNAELKKKIKAGYSVAKDPQVSDVYKSLFTSHKSEQEQNRAHWVTYNPFYN